MANGYRKLRPFVLATVLLLLFSPFLSISHSRASSLILTHPDATWSLLLDLPGFSIKSPKLYRDLSHVWTEANNPDSGILLSVFIEKLPKVDDAKSCRKYYLKKLKRGRSKPNLDERGDAALAEFPIDPHAQAAAQQKHFHAYYFQAGFCVDVHLSKTQFLDEHRQLFFAVLDSLTFSTASDEHRENAKNYVLSSGPGEELLLQAGQLLRSKDFSSADALLVALCPWERARQLRNKGRQLPECTLRTAGFAEGRGLETADTLALLYWRAADRTQKDGMLRAAEEIYKKSLDLAPDHPETWYSLGHLYRAGKDLSSATDAFTRALELKPDDTNTMYWIGTNQMEVGMLPEAEVMFARVLEGDPNDSRVWYRRGQIEMIRGDYKAAIDTFEKARSLGVDSKMVRKKIRECKDALAAK